MRNLTCTFLGKYKLLMRPKTLPPKNPVWLLRAAHPSPALPISPSAEQQKVAAGGMMAIPQHPANPASLSEASWLKILAVIPNQLPPTSQQEHTLGVAPICKYCSLHHGAKQHNQAGKLILSVSWKQNQDKRLPC